ncbi:MAG: hypothetical protein ACFNJO_01215, partial [Porphyromonas endodontalis]
MNVLVLNCGSSSVKYKLFQMPEGKVLAQGGVEKLGLSDSFLKFNTPRGLIAIALVLALLMVGC